MNLQNDDEFYKVIGLTEVPERTLFYISEILTEQF